MFADIKVEYDQEKKYFTTKKPKDFSLRMNVKDARDLAKELNYLADEAEDHESFQISSVVSMDLDSQTSIRQIIVHPDYEELKNRKDG